MIIFLKSGIQTTIQDLGRSGYRNLGINPSGAMDKLCLRKLNILLGNHENEAVIECHFPAPEMLFEQDAIIAVGGANFTQVIDNEEFASGKPTKIQAGSVLKFKKKQQGERAYLAFKGGIAIEKWLDSASTNILINFGGKQIQKGDILTLNSTYNFNDVCLASWKNTFVAPPNFYQKEIRILVGNEYPLLTRESKQLLENQEFTISKNSNRMGYRLEGTELQLVEKFELLSSAVDFGTIQLLPDGQLIILMADHQTTGGYPRMGHICSADLSILAQMSVGDAFRFKLISMEEAEKIYFQTEADLRKLRATMRLFNCYQFY